MKITEVKTYVVGTPPPHRGGFNWVFVKLMTDEGICGYGEVGSTRVNERTSVELLKEMGEYFVVGSDPFKIELLWRRLYTGYQGFQHPDMLRLPVISAFEMACWDIVGKAVNQPVYNLLGGLYNEKLRAYSYIYGWWAGDPPEKAAERAAYYADQGFTAMGFDPVQPPMPNPRELSLDRLRYVENVVKAVRGAVGDKMDILIKTHGQLTPQAAIRMAKRIEPYDPLWFEEPIPSENVDELVRVARATTIPIATGERNTTKYDFVPIIEKQAAAILQPSVGCAGGILEVKKIAAMGEGHFLQIAPWVFHGPIAAAASLHLAATLPNFLLHEGIEMWDGFYAEILKEPIVWEKGFIIPPSKPGLGVELNEEVVAQHPFKKSPIHPYITHPIL
jgi:galactonate dehydratase